MVVGEEIDKRSNELENLSTKWKALTDSLSSLGDEGITERPRTLEVLRSITEEMERRLEGLLGPTGKRLLDFLNGEDEFPADLDLDHIKKGLIRLRPLLMRR